MNTLGIDLSSRAVDLVLVDENADTATWEQIELEGKTAFDRLRAVHALMPQPGWYEAHGVYLIAVEMPESRMRPSLRAQLPVFGAVVAALPDDIEVWCLAPADWKRPMGLGQAKPSSDDFPTFDTDGWTQDSLDALGVALYARDENATGIAAALAAPYPFCRHPAVCAGRSSCPDDRACND